MADPTYSFLPWVRQGLGTTITGTAGGRATIDVVLGLRGEGVDGVPRTAQVKRTVQLVGPGDVVGFDARAVIATQPPAWASGFEPNYLAHVDFYDEDLPWRYTPAAPAGDRLPPWLTLAVLAEDQVVDVAGQGSRPLPAVTVQAAGDVLPPTATLWAWAHTQSNRSLAPGVVTADAPAVAAALGAVVGADADHACSRLLSPRRLQPDTGYVALLLPTFEAGRLAGLGLPPAGAATGAFAWTTGDAADRQFPVYYRWAFRTGVVGDFEYLVRLLQPAVPDERVGRRPLDLLAPGPGLPGITGPPSQGILQLGGALRVPGLSQQDWGGAPPGTHPFQQALAELVNLGDDAVLAGAAAPGAGDPVITPPLYGRWHSLTTRLSSAPDGTAVPNPANWVHELNLDPRHRVAAGLGTTVVQQNQERYVAQAWEQVGRILEANRSIRLSTLGREVSACYHARTLKPLVERAPARSLQLTAAVHGRVLRGATTVQHQVQQSRLPMAAVQPSLRRALRPAGPLSRRLAPPGGPRRDSGATRLLGALATGEVSAAPDRGEPRLPTVEGLLASLSVQLDDAQGLPDPGRVLSTLRELRGWVGTLRTGDEPQRDRPTGVLDALPRSSRFRITALDRVPRLEEDGEDSDEGVRFKQALDDAQAMMAASADAVAQPRPPAVDVDATARALLDGLDPAATFERRLRHVVRLPPRIVDGLVRPASEPLEEVMAHPVLDSPMYEPLVALSDELLVPNLDLLGNNTITLLESNARFIESYLVGLNHEFARELLWREFPTDQRCSSFRQFWEVREVLRSEGDTPAAREARRDVPPLHLWDRTGPLGASYHRDSPPGEDLVLVIRGELLKRYPTAVVYAHRAQWQPAGGLPDRTRSRVLVPESSDETVSRADVRVPLYSATVPPDLVFLGFDLTADEVRGAGDADAATPDNAGWFFVIKERPGQPRFGLDVDSERAADDLRLWNELAWEHVALQSGCLAPTADITLVAAPQGDPDVPVVQHQEDVQVRWGPDTNAADLAYVLYQVPVMVAVHGAEMLRSRP